MSTTSFVKLEFLSPDDSSVVKWNTSLTAKSIYHMAEQVPWQSLTEKNDMSEDGTQVFAYAAVINFTDYFYGPLIRFLM